MAETKRNVVSWQSLTRPPTETASGFWRLVNLAIHCKCAQCLYCRARAYAVKRVCCGLSRLPVFLSFRFQFGHETKIARHCTICNCEPTSVKNLPTVPHQTSQSLTVPWLASYTNYQTGRQDEWVWRRISFTQRHNRCARVGASLVFVPQHLAEPETNVGTLPQIQFLRPLPTC